MIEICLLVSRNGPAHQSIVSLPRWLRAILSVATLSTKNKIPAPYTTVMTQQQNPRWRHWCRYSVTQQSHFCQYDLHTLLTWGLCTRQSASDNVYFSKSADRISVLQTESVILDNIWTMFTTLPYDTKFFCLSYWAHESQTKLEIAAQGIAQCKVSAMGV